MINVICLIQVVYGIVITTTEVKGVVREQSAMHYLVDFSKDAYENGYKGDYSNRIVEKNHCVVTGKGK